MSIPGVVNPIGDQSNGAVITPTVWNEMFDTLYNYLNNVSTPALNTLINSPAASLAAQNLFSARLTAATGIPITKADTTTSTLYLTAFGGDLIGYYTPSSSSWAAQTLAADISIAVPSATRDLCDIFVYWTGTAFALEADLYATATATSSPAASSTPIAISTTSTALFTVGDVISISAGGNSEEAVVTAISSGVSITVDSLQFAYTTPILHSAQPTVALSFQDRVPVKSTDFSRRYVGTVMIISSQVIDSLQGGRCIGNYYNRVMRPARSLATASYALVASASGRANATKALGVERILFVAPSALAVPFELNRNEQLTTTPTHVVAPYFEVDNTDILVATNVQSGTPTSFSCCGHVLGVGRHVIDDFWYNAAAAVTVELTTATSLLGNTLNMTAYTDALILN